MTDIKACIFDLDGVIVDTAKYHYLAWKKIAADLGFEFTEEHNERLKGVSRVRSMEILLEVGGVTLEPARKQELMDLKNQMYVGYISKMAMDEILPGVLFLLRELRDRNIRTAIGSASKNAEMILDHTGLLPMFDTVVDGNKVSKAKPDPEVFLKAAAELGVDPAHCVVFEDAEAGVEAALKGGMRVVGIGNPAQLHQANIVVPNLEGFSFNRLVFNA